MESPGKCLKAERELQNLSLAEAAKFTKIRENFLRAIEEDRYELLPPGFYIKGFLTVYARYLGFDPNDVVLRYQKYLEDLSTSKQKQVELPPQILPQKKRFRLWLFLALIFAIILFVVIFFYYISHEHKVGTQTTKQGVLQSQRRRRPPKTFTSSIGMEFVLIPAGRFTMGSPQHEAGRFSNEGPQHEVEISRAFYMGKYEVTQGQWRAVMGNNPSRFQSCGDDCPVEQVSWDDAQEFIRTLNAKEGEEKYRLPTEAEWEYACRAGSRSAYAFGGDAGRLGEYAWYGGNCGQKTHPVGQKGPNVWGLYDMHGNVWEWCQDWYGKYASGFATDPAGPGGGAGRAYRGGSCARAPRNLRCANRNNNPPGNRNNNIGFRLIRGASTMNNH